MSADSNNNNLEDFFRNSLNNLSADPSSQLWDRIEAGIPARPKKKIKVIYIVFAALILLLLSALIYQYLTFNTQMKDMAQKVEIQNANLEEFKMNFEKRIGQLSSQLNQNSDKTTQDKSADPSNSTTPTVTPHPIKKAIKTGDVGAYGVFDRPVSKQSVSIAGQTEAKDNLMVESFLQKEEAGKSISNKKENLPVILNEKVELLDYLASKPTFPVVQQDFQLEDIHLPKQKKSSTSIEAYTSVYRTFPRVNLSPFGNRSNDFQSYLSKSVGALVNFGINRNWDIQLGLGYSKINVNDGVSKELLYDNEESDGSPDRYASSYSYSVKTNYGDLLISSLLINEKANDGRDIKTGDTFQLNLKFQKQIRYIDLPVFVRYKFGKGNLRYSIKSGIIQKFLYDEQTKLSSVETDSERLMDSGSIIEADLGAIRQSSTDAMMGLGLEYQLTKRNKINIESIFIQSLNEIYKDIQPFSIGIQLGLQHRLGK